VDGLDVDLLFRLAVTAIEDDMLVWPEASSAQNNMAAVSADGSTVCVLILRLNSSCSRSIDLLRKPGRPVDLGGAHGPAFTTVTLRRPAQVSTASSGAGRRHGGDRQQLVP
jgi:hypothetical protein